MPCALPQEIHVGRVDPGFKISTESLRAVIVEAKAAWEQVVQVPLFTVTDNAGVPVNVVYDARQENTEKLKTLDDSIQATESQRREVQARYDVLRADFDAKQAALDEASQAFYAEREAYLADYQAAKNPSPFEQSAFIRRAEALDAHFAALNDQRGALSELADRINALVDQERQLVPDENSRIDAYNAVAHSQGAEFETGLYTSDVSGRTIDLYVYENHDQLLRLLIHEMGHALGLPHVADPQAVMYHLNVSKRPVLTEGDKQALRELCRQADPWQWPALLMEWFSALTSGTSSVPA